MRDTLPFHHFHLLPALATLMLCLHGAPAAASPDDPQALVVQGARHEHGEGIPRDYAKAAAMYCQAARAGSANAQYALAWMYANGRGVARDDGIAAQLFTLAAAQGHTQARQLLNYMPASGAALPPCLQPDPPPAVVARENEEEDPAAPAPGPILALVNKLAPRYNVDPKLALAIMAVESGFNQRALSPKNAQGLMQLIPETAQRFRVKNAFDPEQNIRGGLAYLQWLLAFFQGDVRLVVAAYNAGERAVERYRGIPPYRETQTYVQKVTSLYRKTTHPFGDALAGR